MSRESVHTAIATATGGGGYEGTLIPKGCLIINIWPEWDLTNDLKIETWDSETSSGTQAFPTWTIDGTTKEMRGATQINKRLNTALRVKLTCAGAGKFIVDYL